MSAIRINAGLISPFTTLISNMKKFWWNKNLKWQSSALTLEGLPMSNQMLQIEKSPKILSKIITNNRETAILQPN